MVAHPYVLLSHSVDRTRFELVTEACKATVLANYTNSPFNLGDATVLHISKVVKTYSIPSIVYAANLFIKASAYSDSN